MRRPVRIFHDGSGSAGLQPWRCEAVENFASHVILKMRAGREGGHAHPRRSRAAAWLHQLQERGPLDLGAQAAQVALQLYRIQKLNCMQAQPPRAFQIERAVVNEETFFRRPL